MTNQFNKRIIYLENAKGAAAWCSWCHFPCYKRENDWVVYEHPSAEISIHVDCLAEYQVDSARKKRAR